MLKKCRACEAQISANTKRCPKCGEPQLPEGQKSLITLAIVAFVIYYLYVTFVK